MSVESLVLPVGHDLGVFHTGDGSAPVRQVRLGAEVVELDDLGFELWSSARLRARPTGDPGDLLRAGLLAEVVPGSDGAVEFATGHRLLPLAVGLGNSVEQPWLFSVGLFEQPLAVMTGALFDLWQWAHLSPNLWLACREAAVVAREAGVDDPEQTDPERVLAGALDSVHLLLSAGVACLDVRIEGLR